MSDAEAEFCACEARFKHCLQRYKKREEKVKVLQKEVSAFREDLRQRRRIAEGRMSMLRLLGANDVQSDRTTEQSDVESAMGMIHNLQGRLTDVQNDKDRYAAEYEALQKIGEVASVMERQEGAKAINSRALLKLANLARSQEELTVELEKLEFKDDELIAKCDRLKRVLAVPIDPLLLEEMQVDETEAELEMVRRRHEENRVVDERRLQSDAKGALAIEETNKSRRQEIERVSREIRLLKSMPRRSPVRVKPRKRLQRKVSSGVCEELPRDIGEEKFVDITARHREFVAAERAQEEVEMAFEAKKRANERDLTEKMGRIDRINSDCDALDTTGGNINDMLGRNEKLREALVELQIQKGRAGVVNRNVSQSMQVAQSKRSNNQKLIYAYNVKDQDFHKRVAKCQHRRDVLKRRNDEFASKFQVLDAFEHHVLGIEKQGKRVEGQIEAVNVVIRRLTI